jgi:hypothetical protein
MNLKELKDKAIDRLWELGSDTMGGIIAHFITEKRDDRDQIVLGTDGKPIKVLNMDKIRTEAPHFAKTAEDEAEFIAIKNDLSPALRKSLEDWLPTLGHHQRDDIVLTIAEMTAREELDSDPIENRTKARETAFVALEQLASVPDVPGPTPAVQFAGKNAHAVAFKLMKANELDYKGAWLSEKASQAIVGIIEVMIEVDKELQKWATDTNRGTDQILEALRRRNNAGFVRKLFFSFSRSLALPWEGTEHDMCDDRDRNNTDNNDGRRDADCGNSNARRSKLGLHLCMKGGFNFDFGGYRQRARKDDPKPIDTIVDNTQHR